MPTIAIYPRKSKFSPNSESVANQIALCKEYCDRSFDSPTYLIYDEDEGFSGKNTNRPAFTRLMADLKAGKFDVLCCYRLDRISRSVRDFCALLDELQKHGVAFVSLREQFDTSTPMGRAMVYISSVIAQLERETLAERVRDNLYELAKTGRWLGGNTPLGFEAVSREIHRDEKKRKLLMLSPVENELAQVRDLFDHFLCYGSVTKLLAYCLQNHITSRGGNDYSRTTLRLLLSNPVYATADEDAWEYFSSGNYNLCAEREDFDGKHGIQPFNRTRKLDDLTLKKPTEDWIIAVGRHPGIIPGCTWVRAQQILEGNRDLGNTYKAPRTENALLSGVIRCAKCGGYMRPKAYGKPLADGKRRFSYVCISKVDSRGVRCDMPNAPGLDVDKLVVNHLLSLASSDSEISAMRAESRIAHGAAKRTSADAIAEYEKALISIQKKIDNLVETIASGVPEAARRRLLTQLADYEEEVQKKQELIAELTASAMNESGEVDVLENAFALLESFKNTFDTCTHDERRRAIRAIVDAVTWDGENITIDIFGEKTLPK